ncbi:hypothetical protein ACOME3_004937 [Neoechinorhynchus agilis]
MTENRVEHNEDELTGSEGGYVFPTKTNHASTIETRLPLNKEGGTNVVDLMAHNGLINNVGLYNEQEVFCRYERGWR